MSNSLSIHPKSEPSISHGVYSHKNLGDGWLIINFGSDVDVILHHQSPQSLKNLARRLEHEAHRMMESLAKKNLQDLIEEDPSKDDEEIPF